MRYRGIKSGQYIEILEQLDYIPDGTEIIVDLEFIDGQITEPRKLLTDQERLAKLNELFGTWQNQPELIEIFAEIDQERHAYRGRNIDSIDSQDGI
jgi:antitoxin ParD1/3/4